MSDSIEADSSELPEVLRTLAGVLPQFTGADLESQLQTYDTFLDILNPSVRIKIGALLREAAYKTSDPEAQARIKAAAISVEQGGRAAAPYNNEETMKAYIESFHQSFPLPTTAAPDGKRIHPDILAKLDQIEAEMKKINYWATNPPADFVRLVEQGEPISYLDAPTFELWLQLYLLPRARKAALEDQLPRGSQAGEMARRQYDYMSVDYNAETLLRLLQEFDQLVIQAGGTS